MFVWSFFFLLLLDCLIAWLLDWLIARLLDWLINLPPNSPWWWWYILICIGPTYVQLWKHVCFELVVVVLVAWLPDCLNEWLPDCLIGWSPYLPIDHGDCALFWLVLDLHMYNYESMFVLSFLLLLLLLLDCLIAWTEWMPWLLHLLINLTSPIDHGEDGLFWLVLDLHMFNYESMFVLDLLVVVVVVVTWLPDCWTDWLPGCLDLLITLSPNWPCWWWFVLIWSWTLHMYNYESRFVFSLLMLLLLLLDCLLLPCCLIPLLLDWLIAMITWLIDLPSPPNWPRWLMVYFHWYWTNICTTVKACLFWTYCCCCCCYLIPWLLDWLIARLPELIDHPISCKQFSMQ